MKTFIKVSLVLLLVLMLAIEINTSKTYAEESTDYVKDLEDQVASLIDRVTALEDQYVVMDKLVQIKDSEITRLMDFTRTTKDYQDLTRIVEAEAGGESYLGKMYVASVVVNRVDEGFGSTVHDVIYSPKQFSPVQDGRFQTVKVSEESILATEEIIKFGSVSDALFFMNPDYASVKGREWMRTLTYIDRVGNHEFYRY